MMGRIDNGDAGQSAMQALRESEARFRALADLVPDLLWESEPSGATAWYNARWMEYTGQTLEESKGWGWIDAVHPDERTRSRAAWERSAASGDRLVQEYRIRRHDGEYRWFLVRAEPLRDSSGQITRWFGAATDVHAQHSALDEVERLVVERTAERDKLGKQLAQAEESERRRLARELHDQLGQELTAFRLGLDDAARLVAEHDPALLTPGSALTRRIRQLQDLTAHMMTGARYLAVELRPPELDAMSLADALESYVHAWSARFGIPAQIAVAGELQRPTPEVSYAVYRIAQEALNNVANHARARVVSVVLDQVDHAVRLIVEDDGVGFDVDEAAQRARHERRMGLAGIRERAALVGGTVTVESSPGNGTSLFIRVPAAASASQT